MLGSLRRSNSPDDKARDILPVPVAYTDHSQDLTIGDTERLRTPISSRASQQMQREIEGVDDHLCEPWLNSRIAALIKLRG